MPRVPGAVNRASIAVYRVCQNTRCHNEAVRLGQKWLKDPWRVQKPVLEILQEERRPQTGQIEGTVGRAQIRRGDQAASSPRGRSRSRSMLAAKIVRSIVVRRI